MGVFRFTLWHCCLCERSTGMENGALAHYAAHFYRSAFVSSVTASQLQHVPPFDSLHARHFLPSHDLCKHIMSNFFSHPALSL